MLDISSNTLLPLAMFVCYDRSERNMIKKATTLTTENDQKWPEMSFKGSFEISTEIAIMTK